MRRMTPEEFREVRDTIGWTNPTLAGILGNREDTIKKFANGRLDIPFRVPLELARAAKELSEDAASLAADLLEKYQQNDLPT